MASILGRSGLAGSPRLCLYVRALYHHPTMSCSDRRRDGWRMRIGRKMTFRAKDIHWTSSFFQPTTDSWGKGRRSLLCRWPDELFLSWLSVFFTLPRSKCFCFVGWFVRLSVSTITQKVADESSCKFCVGNYWEKEHLVLSDLDYEYYFFFAFL